MKEQKICWLSEQRVDSRLLFVPKCERCEVAQYK